MNERKTLTSGGMDRREFLKSAGAAAAGFAGGLTLADAAPARAQAVTGHPVKIALGFDNFAIRAWKLKADALIDQAARLKVDVLFMSDLNVYESFEPAYLKTLREKAERNEIRINVGTGSLCPLSNSFDKNGPPAEELLARLIEVAHALGSPAARCFLGNGSDREGDGGIERKQEALIKVLKTGRSRALDKGVKIAVENHAGDQQAWELVRLIEEAGPDFVGANMDSGNAAWTLEDPIESLKTLGPYAVTTSLRDSAIWRDEDGSVFVQWTAMGEGSVDWITYKSLFERICPETPFNLETISGGPRKFEVLNEDFWKVWPKARAADFAAFLRLAQKGRRPEERAVEGATAEEKNKNGQMSDLERSLAFCREKLGLGLRG